jgi:hypothetical protein
MSTNIGENKYLADDFGMGGLFRNLCGAEPDEATYMFKTHYELSADRCEALAKQANNEQQALTTGIEVVGSLLAVAAQTGELSKNTVVDAGFLIENLAKYADLMRRCQSNANFALTKEGQELHKLLRHGTVDDVYVEIPVFDQNKRNGSSAAQQEA